MRSLAYMADRSRDSTMRPADDDDVVYRYGGEEFLIVLGVVPGGDLGAAERVRVAVQDLGLLQSNPPFAIVTNRAKAEGRNRIAMATPTHEPMGRRESALGHAST